MQWQWQCVTQIKSRLKKFGPEELQRILKFWYWLWLNGVFTITNIYKWIITTICEWHKRVCFHLHRKTGRSGRFVYCWCFRLCEYESKHILFLPSWKNECGFRFFQFIIATQRIKSIIQFISRSFHICFWSNGLHVSFYLFIYSFSLFCRECAAVPVLLFQCSCLLLFFFLLTCVKIDSCTSRYYSENRMNNRNLIKSISIKAKTMSALQTDVTEWKLTIPTFRKHSNEWMRIYIALHCIKCIPRAAAILPH